ncbi:MAG TPA: hypothetical protein VMP08_13105 [Anaerolineae bacterium]|nr:hypothetical protein [Anaerolineae bacterium]
MNFPALYAIAVGLLIFGQWAFFLITRQVPELKTERVRVLFHIAAEFLTAALLIVSGVGLYLQLSWAMRVYAIAMGMLLYTIIVSAGYFAQKRVWPIVGMFAALLILTAISLLVFWQIA